jgi:putative addiction module component (TIGR02574 family)
VAHQNTWKDEIARRIKDLDSVKAKTVSWDEVQRRISAKLKNAVSQRKNNRPTR